MKKPATRVAMFVLRWGIAVAGIWWVIANMSLRDRVMILDADNRPVEAVLLEPAREDASAFAIQDPVTGQKRIIPRSQVVNRPDLKKHAQISAVVDGQRIKTELLGLDLTTDLKRTQRVLVADPRTHKGIWVPAGQTDYKLQVPHPRVEVGVVSMVRSADPSLLWAAVLIFPITFLVTSIRWHMLLRALGIRVTQARAFIINMVGAFYNTFMPGSTGGDILKAYYASRQTPHRTQAVISVLVDRVIGLLALIIMGGSMAAVEYAYLKSRHPDDPAARACLRVAVGAAAIIFLTGVGLVLFAGEVRRKIGLQYLLTRLPMQKHVQHAMQAMSMYRRRPGLILWAIIMTFPVHITVVISAMFAGKAFGLPLPAGYYFVVVPVVVLSGAIPISPQGAGVMEFFAIQLTKQHGTTISQAFALTMSIRLVQMLWNLTGGIFVFRGGYHAPSEMEQRELEDAEDGTPLLDCKSETALVNGPSQLA